MNALVRSGDPVDTAGYRVCLKAEVSLGCQAAHMPRSRGRKSRGAAWDEDEARRQSAKALGRYGIELPAHLPLLFDNLPRLRPVGDVAGRAIALCGVMAVREGAPPEGARAGMERRGVTEWITDREADFFDDPKGPLLFPISWRTEALAALAWALALQDRLPLEGAEGVSAEKFFPIAPDRGGARSEVRLRPPEEIAARLDTFYCADWAAREHQLTRRFDPWPEQLVPGSIRERRHALEWLLAEEDWEDVDLST